MIRRLIVAMLAILAVLIGSAPHKLYGLTFDDIRPKWTEKIVIPEDASKLDADCARRLVELLSTNQNDTPKFVSRLKRAKFACPQLIKREKQ